MAQPMAVYEYIGCTAFALSYALITVVVAFWPKNLSMTYTLPNFLHVLLEEDQSEQWSMTDSALIVGYN